MVTGIRTVILRAWAWPTTIHHPASTGEFINPIPWHQVPHQMTLPTDHHRESGVLANALPTSSNLTIPRACSASDSGAQSIE